jgi:hypothetical protein
MILRWVSPKGILVTDQGEIPPTRKFKACAPCYLAHPGVCRTRDAHMFSELQSASRCLLEKLMDVSFCTGCFVRFVAKFSDGKEVHSTHYFASRRRGGPRLGVFVQCALGAEASIEIDVSSGQFKFDTDCTVLSKFFRLASEVAKVQDVCFAVLKHMSKPCTLLQVQEVGIGELVLIYPPAKRIPKSRPASSSLSKMEADMKAAMDNIMGMPVANQDCEPSPCPLLHRFGSRQWFHSSYSGTLAILFPREQIPL